ncbi:protein yellow-like [Cloeon dipterum]|uniref:protein yellow-like n=1 Tax=Cloeon dipterum TaxID=197152 RepID=UPI00321FB329
MTPFFVAIFLLATADTFTQAYESSGDGDTEDSTEDSSYDESVYDLSMESCMKQDLEYQTFKPQDIEARYMAVYGTRIFISLGKSTGIPATLFSFPTNGAFSASPNLTPFPSLVMHKFGDCNKIEEARGVQVDAVGRLWVLDYGSDDCNGKIWTIDLSDNDHTELIHRFGSRDWIRDLALDETPNGTLAYISQFGGQHIVVYSLERNQSWTVHTPGIKAYSIALSPKDEEPRQLYLGQLSSTELFSISVAELRNGNRTSNPKLIGNWTAEPYRMRMDNHGTMYATFRRKNFIQSWKTSQPFEEQHFHEVAGPNNCVPFTFALDHDGILLIMLFDYCNKPRLLEAAVGEKSFKTSPEQCQLFNIILICSNVFTVILSGLIILWLILRQRRNNSIPPNTNEVQEMPVIADNHADDVGPAESAAVRGRSHIRPGC